MQVGEEMTLCTSGPDDLTTVRRDGDEGGFVVVVVVDDDVGVDVGL